jgi:hypothetical protein
MGAFDELLSALLRPGEAGYVRESFHPVYR